MLSHLNLICECSNKEPLPNRAIVSKPRRMKRSTPRIGPQFTCPTNPVHRQANRRAIKLNEQPATALENQFHRKLNYARIAFSGLDASKTRRRDRSGWRSEIHHVKRVEEFAPKLHVQALGEGQVFVQ